MAMTPLDAQAIYLAPSGRRCRWVPLGGKYRHYTAHAFFEYLDAPRRVGEPEGFCLAAANYRLLKVEACHAAAR